MWGVQFSLVLATAAIVVLKPFSNEVVVCLTCCFFTKPNVHYVTVVESGETETLLPNQMSSIVHSLEVTLVKVCKLTAVSVTVQYVYRCAVCESAIVLSKMRLKAFLSSNKKL